MSYTQDNNGYFFTQYPTPDNSQPLTNSSQLHPRTSQIINSFLSDVPQGSYSECSTLDNSSSIPTNTQESNDLAPHTPESLLYSPALDTSAGDDSTDQNLRKQQELPQPILRRSPRFASNNTSHTYEQQSDSTSLGSQASLNNRELIKSPASLALEVLNDSTDLNLIQQILSGQEKDTLDSNIHHNYVSHKSKAPDDEVNDIEYLHKQQQNKTTRMSHESSQSELEREHENENEYSESVDFIIANEISDTLLRQSAHYNDMASRFSNIKFIRVEPDSEEEIEKFTTPINPGIRRSMRKRTTANYNYPRYSYGGRSKRYKKRNKRNRPFLKRSLPATKNEADVDSENININNERIKEANEPMHDYPPVQSDEEQEANEDTHNTQDADVDDSGNADKVFLDSELQNNLYLKHDLRSRRIMLELPEVAAGNEEAEKDVANTTSKNPNKLAKRSISKKISKKSTKAIPKRRTYRKSTSRKKNEDHEWHPDEAGSELGKDSDSEVLVAKFPKTRLSKTPKKVMNVNNIDVINANSEVNNKKGSSNKRTISKNIKPPKTTKRRGNPTRGRGRGRTSRGSRSKNCDTDYIYSGEEETETEIEIVRTTSKVADMVDDNSEYNQIVSESSYAETGQNETEQNASVIEEPISTPVRPKRTTPKSTRSTRSTRSTVKRNDSKKYDMQDDESVISNIYVPSDEEINVPEIPVDVPATPPKKSKSIKSKRHDIKAKDGHVGGNTSTNQPIDPTPDRMVAVTAGNKETLANAVRTLAEKSFDIISTPENIVPENNIKWSENHWRELKIFYNEIKSKYIQSGKVAIGSKGVYREVTHKFYEVYINYRTLEDFREEKMYNRIKALEKRELEEANESSSEPQRRNSIGSNSSMDSRYSVSRYSTLTKRKRSESTTIPESKKDEENIGTEDRATKRSRVEENMPSGSDISSTHSMNASQIPHNNMLSRLFGSWFSSGRSQSLNEETPVELTNNAGGNESNRSKSWW